jgi:hypothetical protein
MQRINGVKKKKVLIACERSGKVREAFRKLGHDAYSCDVVPADDGSPFHFTRDVMEILGWSWDLLIAHPPCTYLCNSGVCWLWKPNPHHKGKMINEARRKLLHKAGEFFLKFKMAQVPMIAIENPIPHRYARNYTGAYTQIIQPWMFGHPESKATCLWLKNLPKLVETDNVKHIWQSLPKAEAQRLHYLPPSANRAKLRSETYQGIADAMAEQWGNL